MDDQDFDFDAWRTKMEALHQERLKYQRVKERAELREALFMLILGVTLVTVLLFVGRGSIRKLFFDTSMRPDPKVQVLQGQMAYLAADLKATKERLAVAAPGTVGLDDAKDLERRLTRLEDAISDSPEKALSLPLMRKDLEATASRVAEIQSRTDADVRQVAGTVNAIFWSLLSAMAVLILSGLGVVVRIYLRGRMTAD